MTCGGCAGICGDVGFPFSWTHSVENGICPSSQRVCGDGCSAALLLLLLHPCHSLQTCCNFLFLLRRGCFPPGRLQGERPRQGGSRPAGTGSWLSAQLAGRGRVAGAGQRGGRRAVSAEQVAACLGGRAPAPRTSALCAWPWGHWGCWGYGAGGGGGPGLPGLGASFHRAQVCRGSCLRVVSAAAHPGELTGHPAGGPRPQGLSLEAVPRAPPHTALPPAQPQSSSRPL